MKLRNTVVFAIALSLDAHVLQAASSFSYRVPTPLSPSDPILVYLDLTSSRDKIAAIASRLTYDATKVSLVSLEKGAGTPASWSFIYQAAGTPGEVDFALTDQTSGAVAISPAPASVEIVKLTFSRVGGDCASVALGFNSAPPPPGSASAAFPDNHCVIYISPEIQLETVATSPGSVPSTADHGFIRGNVSNRIAHHLDIQDVMTLVGTLFQGLVPAFDCAAAFDVNNDGGRNLIDVVALVQGLFGVHGYVIPPPGPTTPGVGTADGGTVPSVLGCLEGEVCL